MAVHNEKYKEILGLLGDMYVKYIDIDNSVTSTAPFIQKILKDISEEEIVDFPLLEGDKVSLYGQELNATDTGPKSGAAYYINNDSFTDLINQAIYTKINIMEVDKDNDNIDNLAKTKGYLKFAKGSIATPKGTVRIYHNEDNIFNLICSMNLVNVFIDILEAYKNFLENNNNIEHFKKNVNNIIIVNKYARDAVDASENYGYWVNGTNEANKMSESTLFLSIKSYDSGVDGGTTATNKLFTELRVKYNGYAKNVEAASAQQTDEITTAPVSAVSGGLFVNSNIRNVANTASSNTLSGIVIKKLADGRCVIKQHVNDIYLDDNNNSFIEANTAELYNALIERDKRLLRNFLNTIIKLNLVNRKTQILGLLKFFKIIKAYFHIAITSGNMLYNSIHNKIDLGASATPCGAGATTPAACDYTLYNATPANSTGYGIKYLTEADILEQATYIYGDAIKRPLVIGVIKLAGAATDGSDANNSVFGLAYTENNTYVDRIIEKITDLHMKSAKAANIAISDEFPISKKGFIAEVLSERLIRIKTRIPLFNNKKTANAALADGAAEKKGETDKIFSGNFYVKASTPDALITYGDPDGALSTGDKSFKVSAIRDSELPIAVKNQLSDRNMDIAKTHIININNTSYPIMSIQSDGGALLEFTISARLIYPSQNDKELKDVPVLTLPYQSVTLFSSSHAPLPDTATSHNYFGSFDKGSYVYFHAGGNTASGFDNQVFITVKKPLDYKNGYINNVDAINNINEQINSNQSKIKNIKTLYYLNKSKNNLLYYQLVSYIILLLGIIITLGLTYAMKMEKPIIKLVSSVCFGIVVLQVVTYYILGVLYIEAFTQGNVIENFSNQAMVPPGIVGTTTTEFTADGNHDYPSYKINLVNTQLLLLNSKLIKAIELANVSVGQGDATSAYTTLLGNTLSERNTRADINKKLSSEADGSLMHIDLLKYSASVYGVYIKTVLMVGLAITALFTINLYTDNKYMENIAFICIFILVVIFSYYLIYSNAIVRTKSNNIYWGKENKSQYN